MVSLSESLWTSELLRKSSNLNGHFGYRSDEFPLKQLTSATRRQTETQKRIWRLRCHAKFTVFHFWIFGIDHVSPVVIFHQFWITTALFSSFQLQPCYITSTSSMAIIRLHQRRDQPRWELSVRLSQMWLDRLWQVHSVHHTDHLFLHNLTF